MTTTMTTMMTTKMTTMTKKTMRMRTMATRMQRKHNPRVASVQHSTFVVNMDFLVGTLCTHDDEKHLPRNANTKGTEYDMLKSSPFKD